MTLEGWARVLELRDKEIEGHSRRVTELMELFAVKKGYTTEQQTQVRRGALLHDIGKMAIPDHILQKSSQLTQEEWALIKTHPIEAKKMLAPIKYLESAMDIPYSHHENWDGTGYPEGLSGEAIPEAARMFALVDNWDALLSNRPYRKAWSKKDTKNYILKEAGKKFDPSLIPLFMDIVS